MIEEILKNVSSKESLTKFLSPEEQALVVSKRINYSFYPENCERKRAIISRKEIESDDYNISIIKISYNKKFGDINHRDVLGSLIGLGMKRECIGDIIVSDDIYVYLIKEMEQFVLNNLIKVGRVSVDVTLSSLEEVNKIDVNNYVEDEIIVSSYRLDTIVSERCKLSRDKAKQYINLKNVKVNGVVNTNPDYTVKIDDLISIHRFGRLIVKEEVKKTKKDRYVLKIFITK